MVEYHLVCNKCNMEIKDNNWIWRHETCNGTLRIEYKLKGSFKDYISEDKKFTERYVKLLPCKTSNLPPIPIGSTPTSIRNLKQFKLVFKLEYLNPSGSFKDRGVAITIAKLREFKVKDVIVDSSGNAAIALTLQGVMMGYNVHVYIPADAPSGKIEVLRKLGAEIYPINGSREDVNRAAIKASMEGMGSYVGHWWNPYFIEGIKTIAYEIYEEGFSIDSVLAPVGSGTLILGLYKGFKDLENLGAIKSIPRLIAVQAEGYNPICIPLGGKASKVKSKIADGIRIRNPPRKEEISKAIRETAGTCVTVDDKAIKEALKELFKMGFLIEPTSAAPYAALKILVKREMDLGNQILIPLTGSGLKMH